MLHSYDVRLERDGGRFTLRVAAVSNREARKVAAYWRPGWTPISARRSQYAVGAAERGAYFEYVRNT